MRYEDVPEIRRGTRGLVPHEILARLRHGGILLISGPPGAGKTTMCSTIAASRPCAVVVSLAAEERARSTAANRTDRVMRARAAAERGAIVLLDACAATPRTLAYWTCRLPELDVVRLVS